MFVFFDSPYDFGFNSIPLILVGPVDEGVFDPFSEIQIGVFELTHLVLALIYIFFSSSSHGVVFVYFEAGSKDLLFDQILKSSGCHSISVCLVSSVL